MLRLLVLSVLLPNVSALSLSDFKTSARVTPEQFAASFSDFSFVFRAKVQKPEVFLKTKAGDCDDFSVLASMVLKEHGYTPRLIAVRMPGIVHVICYVDETKSYLDYNLRCEAKRTKSCGNSMEEIAASVAESFHAPWASASEFTFSGGTKYLVATTVNEGQRNMASNTKMTQGTRLQ